MRGEVLHYDEAQGFGFITGSDGQRYTFRREDMRRAMPMTKGVEVEFQAEGGQAKGVFALRETAPWGPAGTAVQPAPAQYGRYAGMDQPAGTGLWSYFWRSLTTNYVAFGGRARRKEYWGFALFWSLAIVVLTCVAVGLDGALGNLEPNHGPYATIIALVLFVLATFLPALAMNIRRIHDIGLSGWFYLLSLIPYVGSMIIFVFALIPSQAHDNRWGPVPPGVRVPGRYVPPAAVPTPGS